VHFLTVLAIDTVHNNDHKRLVHLKIQKTSMIDVYLTTSFVAAIPRKR